MTSEKMFVINKLCAVFMVLDSTHGLKLIYQYADLETKSSK